jgi:hypothetical protein
LGAIAAAVLGGCGVACALGDPIAPTPPDPRPDARSDAWPEPGGPGELAALAVRVDEGPRIDGVLDDAMWSLAAPSDDFRQADPVVGAEPSERTAFRVVYTETDLYIGVRCFVEAGGGTVLARQTRRDQGAQGDDSIFVSFDTNRDGQSGFFFEVGAAGARGDGLIDNDSPPGPLLGRDLGGPHERGRGGVVRRDPDPLRDLLVRQATSPPGASMSAARWGASVRTSAGATGAARGSSCR